MFEKIWYSIPIIILLVYCIYTLPHHDERQIEETLKRLDTLSVIILVVSSILLYHIWHPDDEDYSYCKLNEEEYEDIILSIDEFKFACGHDDSDAILWCYFEGEEDVDFMDAKKAYENLAELNAVDLMDNIAQTLENNFIDNSDR